ncbi:MAG: SDR family NAD(P)-dependent oxidoreductase [Solirubrobacteraceae bacterium]|jgi:short-subunit dehydrogenase
MAERFQIAGARTLLTGATGGIGSRLAWRLASEGAKLVLTGRREAALDALAAALGADTIVADLSDADQLERLIAQVGAIDLLVANAALPGSGRLAQLELDDIDRAIAVNLRAPIVLARELGARMTERRAGHMVFVGSLSSKAATPGSSLYNATKFGLRGFALALRAELARSGVGVSLVLPGFVSEVGMFADSGVELPRGVGTSRPDEVTDALVGAIRHNRGEVVVAPLGMRAGATFASFAPELAARATRLAGGDRIALRFESAQADKR